MLSELDLDTLIPSVEALQSRERKAYAIVKDNVFDDIVEALHHEVQCLKELLRPAKMNRGADMFEDEIIRGDSLCWVTPALVEKLNLVTLQQYADRIVTECSAAMGKELGLGTDYHMQFAVYPGGGEGYNRHRDAFPRTAAELATAANGSTSPLKLSRQLTCLLYLNKDWEPEDGGRLRVFTHPGVEMDIKGAGERFSFWGTNGYDIDPSFGRMVIFRSELVEHAVLPCFNTERMALTIWLHGTGPAVAACGNIHINSKSVFSFSHSASKPYTTGEVVPVEEEDQDDQEQEEEEEDLEEEEKVTKFVAKDDKHV